MATYYSNVFNTTIRPASAGAGGVVTVAGSVLIPAGTGLATGDVIKLFRVGSGGHVRSLWLQNSDFGTDAPGTLGHYGCDDGAAIDADSIMADVVLETAADRAFENLATAVQTSGTAFQAPFATLTEDASFEIVVGTMNTPTTSGSKYIKFAVDVIFFGADRAPYAYTWNGLASNLNTDTVA